MDAASSLAARIEAPPELHDEAVARQLAVLELLGEAHQPAEIGLARELALAESVRRILEPASVGREPPNPHRDARRGDALQLPEQPPRRLAPEQRRALEWQAGVV